MTDATIDPRALRDAFGCFMTGVTVVTTIDADNRPRGFTANSFTSVSMDPPLLLVSMSNNSSSKPAFTEGRGFAVNILAEAQKEVSATFTRKIEDRFATIPWAPGPIGSPLIDGVAAWFDCTLHQTVVAGDHTLLIGRIGAFASTAQPGLGYYRGAYITPAATTADLPAGPDVVIAAILERPGEVLLVPDGKGGQTLPGIRVGREGIHSALDKLLASLGAEAGPGSIYSVYEDRARGTHMIALRCPALPCQPRTGAFAPLSPEGVSAVADSAERIMLERLAAEARMGNYGIYFGTHEQGRVQPLAKDRTP